MTLRIGLASLLALAVAATPTIAVGQTPAPAGDNKVVCKGETKPNSRFKDKVCRTRAQWEQLRSQQQREAREFIERPTIETRRGG